MVIFFSFFDLVVNNTDLAEFKRLSSIQLQGNVF